MFVAIYQLRLTSFNHFLPSFKLANSLYGVNRTAVSLLVVQYGFC